MTLDQLKQKIKDAGREIIDIEQIGSFGTYTEHRVQTFYSDGDTGESGGFNFYKNRDTGDCYFQGSKPNYLQTETISERDKVKDFIASKVSDGTIEHGKIDDFNQQTNRALVKYVKSDGTKGEAIIKKENGSWSLNIL